MKSERITMTDPIFSIIIPTYKRPRLLERAVRSVLDQTFKNFDLIVIDDGNDPDTVHVINQMNDSRIILVQHNKTSGAAAAYNTGIKASKGTLITFLGDDDEYLPLFLEYVYKTFQNTDPAVGFLWTAIANVRDEDDAEIALNTRKWPDHFEDKEKGLIEATTIGNGFGFCMKKSCVERIGYFDETLPVCVDTEYLFRLVKHFDFVTIPQVLTKIHYHKNGQLTDIRFYQDRLKIHEKILNENSLFLKQYPKVKYVHYQRLIQMSYEHNLKNNGRRLLIKQLKSQPARYRLYWDFICYEILGKPFRTYLRQLLHKLHNTR